MKRSKEYDRTHGQTKHEISYVERWLTRRNQRLVRRGSTAVRSFKIEQQDVPFATIIIAGEFHFRDIIKSRNYNFIVYISLELDFFLYFYILFDDQRQS